MGELDKYSLWIQNNCSKDSAEVTLKMLAQFPELKRVKGIIQVKELLDLPPTRYNHWWLKDKNEIIYDPSTQSDIINYIEDSEIIFGWKCYNCGGICVEGNHFCTLYCEHTYLSKLNMPLCKFKEYLKK